MIKAGVRSAWRCSALVVGMNSVPSYIPPYYITSKRTNVGCGGAVGTGDNPRLSRPERKIAPSGGNFGTAPAALAIPPPADSGGDPVRQAPDRANRAADDRLTGAHGQNLH